MSDRGFTIEVVGLGVLSVAMPQQPCSGIDRTAARSPLAAVFSFADANYMSPVGTFRTCTTGLTTSVDWSKAYLGPI